MQAVNDKLCPLIFRVREKSRAELMNNDDIIIRHADKGAIVVQDKTLYIKELERQLSDRDVYTPLHTDPT